MARIAVFLILIGLFGACCSDKKDATGIYKNERYKRVEKLSRPVFNIPPVICFRNFASFSKRLFGKRCAYTTAFPSRYANIISGSR